MSEVKVMDIYTDASLLGKIDPVKKNLVCAGAVAIGEGGRRLAELHRRLQGSTNNAGELTGIALAVMIIHRYQDEYKEFNIYSDSLLSIRTLREWIFEWLSESSERGDECLPERVKNQEIILRIADFVSHQINPDIKINLVHCNGHINKDNKNHMRKAFYNIMSNYKTIRSGAQTKLKEKVKTIQMWNDYIDRSTRLSLKEMQFDIEYIYDDVLDYRYVFCKHPIFEYANNYSNIISQNLILK